MEGILRTLRLRLRLFLQAKKIYGEQSLRLEFESWGTLIGFSPPSLCELWRASFARFVYDFAYFCKQKKSTDSRMACHP